MDSEQQRLLDLASTWQPFGGPPPFPHNPFDTKGPRVGHYKSNLRDLEFNLFEALRIGDVLDSEAYGDLDSDAVHTMLAELRRVAEGPFADAFAEIDRNPPTFDPDTHTVRLPEPLKKAYRVAIADPGGTGSGSPRNSAALPPRAP